MRLITYPCLGYYISLGQNIARSNNETACDCIAFELKANGGAKSSQSSRLGMYERLGMNDIVNDRGVYYNKDKRQYLSWIEKGHWMVSRRTVSPTILLLNVPIFYLNI